MNTLLPPGASHLRLPHPSERLRPKKPASSVTLIVGIKTKQGVVMAADCQISYGTSSQRTDIPKVEQVKFKNFPALVAWSDNMVNSQRFIDILSSLASEAEPKSADEVGKVAQTAMFMLREELKHATYGDNGDLEDIILRQSLESSITIGFYLNGQSHLVKTTLSRAIYNKSRADWEADGCGAILAEYLLTEHRASNSDLSHAILTAIYTILTVTKHDRNCRAPIVVGIATGPGGLDSDGKPRVMMLSPENVAELVRVAEQIDAASKEERHAVIQTYFAERQAEYSRMLEEYSKAWEDSDLGRQANSVNQLEEGERYLKDGHGTDPATEKE